MSARNRSKAVSIFVFIVIGMLLFSVMGVVVLYLKGPVMPPQTAGLTGTNNTGTTTTNTGRVLYQAPQPAAPTGSNDTGAILPAQTGATTGN